MLGESVHSESRAPQLRRLRHRCTYRPGTVPTQVAGGGGGGLEATKNFVYLTSASNFRHLE